MNAENVYILEDRGILYINGLDAGEFLQVDEYKNVVKWAKNIGSRPTVERARMINRITGDEMEQVEERHDKSDLEGKSGIKV